MPMLRPAVKRFQPSFLRMGCWPALTCQSSFLQIRKDAEITSLNLFEDITFLIKSSNFSGYKHAGHLLTLTTPWLHPWQWLKLAMA